MISQIRKLIILTLLNNKKMAQLYSQYSLTNYTDFRKLQFECVRLRDQNELLKCKLIDLQVVYEEAIWQLTDHKRQNTRNELEKADKLKQQISAKSQISKQIRQIIELFYNLKNERRNPTKDQRNENGIQLLIELRSLIQQFVQQFHHSKRSAVKMLQQAMEKQKAWTERQENFSDEVAQLQIDLKALQKLQSEMQKQNEKVVRQNQQLIAQIKSYKAIAIQARNQRSPTKTQHNELQVPFNQDDKDFATDLLGYQKQLLARVFSLVIESFHNNDIQICLRKIYESYEDVIQCFRQKLQIEYDLSDIECQYQKQKSVGVKQTVVELRKQISNFRKQLFNQKQLLHKKQDILQDRIKDLSGQAVHDNRLKSFTIDLQSKLRKQKTQSAENEQQFDRQKTATLQFRHTVDADQMVKQMIQKDRQNLQKMLKQTRNQYRKQQF